MSGSKFSPRPIKIINSRTVKWKSYFNYFRYKKYFEEGKLEKSFEVCREYLNRLDELKVAYPHRNYEIATIALCSCLWGMTQSCWHMNYVYILLLLFLLLQLICLAYQMTCPLHHLVQRYYTFCTWLLYRK